MRLLRFQATLFIALILRIFLPASASGCPIPPPPGVTPPDWFYTLSEERPELYEIPKEAIERQQKLVQNRKLLKKGLITPEQALVMGGTSPTGTWKIPVVMGLFNNTPSEPFPKEMLQQELFDGPWSTGTLKEFYLENSYGKFTFDGTVYDWVRVSKNDTYYEGGCNGVCGSARTGEFIKEILDQLDSTIDFSQFDNDGDGKVEALAVIHPEADGACGTTNIWAHRWTLSGWSGVPYVTNDGVVINDYIIQGLYCNRSITRIGVLAHELGHILGLPDLYDTDRSSAGLGRWELMASGSWNGLGARPAHMCGWSKTLLGWLTPEEVTSNQFNRTIQPFENYPGSVLKLSTPYAKEYFLLENRQLIGFDNGLPGRGLLIYHVDDSTGSFRMNNVNQRENCGFCSTAGHYRIALVQADAYCNLECGANRGDIGDPFPGNPNNTTFDSTSNPSSLTYSGNNTCVAVRNIQPSSQNIIADVLVADPDNPACGGGGWVEDCTNGIDYSNGLSYINYRYTGNQKDNAYLRICLDSAFCNKLKEGIEDIVIGLDNCNQITIPGYKLRFSRNKYSARSARGEKPAYNLIVDCAKDWLSLRLWDINLKDCVSNSVKTCVSVKDGPCYCAEEMFVEELYKWGKYKGRLRNLSLSVKEACPRP